MVKRFIAAVYIIICFYACGTKSGSNKSREEIMQHGSELYFSNGCNVCHSMNGTVVYGPPLNDIYMKEITVVRNGKERTIKADRKYLKKAIIDPRHEKNAEYRNKEMPLTSFTNEEAELLVDYIIALSVENNQVK
jgi:hypothetical protein